MNIRWLAPAGLAAAALMMAACGTSSTSTGPAGGAAPAATTSSAPAASGSVLKTAKISGVTVLTDAAGFTLYWFGPDTPTTSKCTGSCSRRWPPVTGPVTAGAGVSGAVGWIRRPDGAIQATYDGHPLYTAIVDTAPGEARGNGVTASGGRWHEVTVRGAAAPASSPSPGMGSGGGYGLSGACSAHRRPRYARTTCGR